MRIDKFLKLTGVFKSREQARKACRYGSVKLNGEIAKPASEIAVGDTIEISLPTRHVILKVLRIPGKNVPRKDRHLFVDIIEDRHIKPHETESFWDSLPGDEL